MSKEGEIETQKLPCKLSPSEREAKNADLVRLEQERSTQEAEKKAWVSKKNAQLKQTRAQIDQTVKELHEGTELRDVEVETVYRFGENRVDYVRRDTQGVVSSRDMDAYDRQESLPDPEMLPPPAKPQKRTRRKRGELVDVPDSVAE